MNDSTASPSMSQPNALVRDLELAIAQDQRESAQRLMRSLGVILAVSDDVLSLRLNNGVGYQDAVSVLEHSPAIRFIYCHAPVIRKWKSNEGLSADAEEMLQAAARDFAGLAASPRVAKGAPASAAAARDEHPANPAEDRFVVPKIPNQQYYVPPLLGYPQWREVGPRGFAVGNSWWSGRVDAVAYHPANPQTFYVGSNNGGLWRTTDGGASYTPLSDRWDSLAILAIAVDGSKTPERVFVGKGGSEATLLRSDDGGVSFQPVHPSLFAKKSVKGIYVDPDRPSVVLAAVAETNSYVCRSTNNGQTFEPVLTDVAGNALQGNWRQIKGGIKVGGTRYVYALGTMGSPPQSFLLRSADAGATWTSMACPEDDSLGEMAPSQTAVGTLYFYSPQHRRVWKSLFAGSGWGVIYSPGDPPFDAPDTSMFNQPGANVLIGVARRTVDGTARDVIYVGGVQLMRSVNGGTTWEEISVGHSDYCCFDLAPSGGGFLIGTHGGVFQGIDTAGAPSQPPLGLLLFSQKNRGLGITQFYTGSFSSTSNLAVLGGTQDNGTVSRLDADDWRIGSFKDGGASALSAANNDIQFGSDQDYFVYKTENRWQSHEDITPAYGVLVGIDWVPDQVPALGSGTFEMDPAGGELYAGTNYLYRYNLLTSQWTKRLGGQCFATNGLIQSIKVAATDPNRVYVGSSEGLWMSKDRGLKWTRIDISAVGYPTSLPGQTIFVSVHPTNPNDVLAIVKPGGFGSAKLYRCANTTASPRVWTELSVINGASGLARDFDDPGRTFYVAVYNGVIKSVDGGETWTRFDYQLGLPTLVVKAIAAIKATRSLWVATYGRGFWKMTLPPVLLSLEAPSGAVSGGQATATVSLGREAQLGGENVYLSTDFPEDAPRCVTVPEGSASVTFSLDELRTRARGRQIEVRASVGASSVVRTIGVKG